MVGMLHITHLNGKEWIIPPSQVQCKIIDTNKKSNLCLNFIDGNEVHLLVMPKNYKSMTISDELARAYCGGVGRLIEISADKNKKLKAPTPREKLQEIELKYKRYNGLKWMNTDMPNPIEISEIKVELTNKGEYYFSIYYKAPTGESIGIFGCADENKFKAILVSGIDRANPINSKDKDENSSKENA